MFTIERIGPPLWRKRAKLVCPAVLLAGGWLIAVSHPLGLASSSGLISPSAATGPAAVRQSLTQTAALRVFVLDTDLPLLPRATAYDATIPIDEVVDTFGQPRSPRLALIIRRQLLDAIAPPPPGEEGSMAYQALLAVLSNEHVLFVLDATPQAISDRLGLARGLPGDPYWRPVSGNEHPLDEARLAGTGLLFADRSHANDPNDGWHVLMMTTGLREETDLPDPDSTAEPIRRSTRPPYPMIYGSVKQLADELDGTASTSQLPDQGASSGQPGGSECDFSNNLKMVPVWHNKWEEWYYKEFHYDKLWMAPFGDANPYEGFEGWPYCCPMGRVNHYLDAWLPVDALCVNPRLPIPPREPWPTHVCHRALTSGTSMSQHLLGAEHIVRSPIGLSPGLRCVAGTLKSAGAAFKQPPDEHYSCRTEEPEDWIAFHRVDARFTALNDRVTLQAFAPEAGASGGRMNGTTSYYIECCGVPFNLGIGFNETIPIGIVREVEINMASWPSVMWSYENPEILHWYPSGDQPTAEAVMCPTDKPAWVLAASQGDCKLAPLKHEAAGSKTNLYRQGTIWVAEPSVDWWNLRLDFNYEIVMLWETNMWKLPWLVGRCAQAGLNRVIDLSECRRSAWFISPRFSPLWYSCRPVRPAPPPPVPDIEDDCPTPEPTPTPCLSCPVLTVTPTCPSCMPDPTPTSPPCRRSTPMPGSLATPTLAPGGQLP